MTPCDSWLPDLCDDVSGELPAARRDALDAHLAVCPGCKAERAALAGTEALLHATARPPDPLETAGLAHRATDRAERFRDRSLRGLFWSFTRAQRFVAGFSTAALALSLGFFLSARTAPVVPAESSQPLDPVSVALVVGDEAVDFDDDAADPSLDDAFQELSNAELDALTELLAG